MTLFRRQLVALTKLVFRFWARGGLPSQVRDERRRKSGALFRLVFVLSFAMFGYRIGTLNAAIEPSLRAVAAAWMLLGVGFLGFGWSMAAETVVLRDVQRAPFAAPMLNGLPISETSRVIVGLIEKFPFHAFVVASVVAVAREARATSALFGLLVSITILFSGSAAMRLMRTVLDPMRIARVSVVLYAVQITGVIVALLGGYFARTMSSSGLVGLMLPVGRTAVHGELGGAAGVLALAVVAALGIRLAERIGYDRVDLVPTAKLEQVPRSELTLEKVERVLTNREPGGRMGPWVACAQTIALAGGLVLLVQYSPATSRMLAKDPATVANLLRIVGVLTIFSGFAAAQPRSNRIVVRDVSARPMLSALPIRPSDLLEGKTRSLFRSVLLAVTPFFLLLLLPAWPDVRQIVLWRGITIVCGALLAASASVSVGFLTQGLGGVRALGTTWSLESTLVATPLLAIGAAPFGWNAVIGLVMLALVALEARRSALRCVRWLDDPDDFERETPVWRALIVLAAFQAVQTLSSRLVSVIPIDEGHRVSLAYAVSAVILVMLTIGGRRGLPPIPIVPKSWVTVPLGALLGATAGALALHYLRFLHAHGLDAPSYFGDGHVRVVAVPVVVLLAPLAEETFFRGWLQGAIGEELSPRWKLAAPVLTSLAFAAVHPPLSFVPVLLLGFFTGFLAWRTRSIGPGIIAHAVFNAMFVFLPP